MYAKKDLLTTLRYNSRQIKSERLNCDTPLSNYDYLYGLGKRLDAIFFAIRSLSGYCPEYFANEPVAMIVANSIHHAVNDLIPSFGLGDFDWAGTGEDLCILVGKAHNILQACDEDGMAQRVCDRLNLFITMCELQEKLDEEWLTTIAND